MEKYILETKKYKVALLEFVIAVENKVAQSVSLGLGSEVIEPFEATIDKESIDTPSLIRYAKLPIEVIMLHDRDGNLILSTGSKGKSSYNFGPEREKAIKTFTEQVSKPDRDTELFNSISQELRNYDNADRVQLLRKYNQQPFIAHQHPSRRLRPSIEDLLYLLSAKSESNIIFTDIGVAFYTATFEVIDDMMEKLKSFKNAGPSEIESFLDAFYRENNVILGVVEFTDPNFSHVLDFLKGKISFKDLSLFLLNGN